MAGSVLLLAPSQGLGGGIERYVSTVEAALSRQTVPVRRLNLCTPEAPATNLGRLRFIWRVRRAVQASRQPVRLVVAHRNLLPAVRAVSRHANYRGATVIVHGSELWSARPHRGVRAMRHPSVRVVAASNFTAGALARACRASVLHPGISAEWYQTLVAAGESASRDPGERRLVTAFRLASWRDKGLDTLLEAVRLLGDERVRLTVCGRGPAPPELLRAVAVHPWCRIAADLSDRSLAAELAAADLFVLCTRTRPGRTACGEGFGLVLLEAQLAGTPVIAPAFGGSGDAFLRDHTGLVPVDESPGELSGLIASLLANPWRLDALGQAAADWSRTRFDPLRYDRHIVRTLLDSAPATPPQEQHE